MHPALRPYVTAGTALVGASIIAATPVAPPPPDVQVRAVQLTSGDATDAVDVTLAMGGTGLPIPPPEYVTDVTDRYVTLSFPDFTSANAQPLFTPEGFTPATGVKSLPFDTSVAQGQQILDSAIMDQVAAGNSVAVLGYSQSATISSIEMDKFAAAGNPVPADDLHFVLIGDPNAPNGGILERFDGLTFPSLGIPFSGATPPDTIYPTDIYTIEYDGFADSPQYPINLLADLNAGAGTLFVHGTYPTLTSEQIDTRIELPTSPGYDGVTTYWMIPTENLPLLQPLRDIPLVGTPLADLIQPDLTQIVNLGYENPANEGWSVPANVPTQFGLFPPLDQVITAIKNLVPGTEDGIRAFVADLGSLSTSSLLSEPPSLFTSLLSGGGGSPADLLSSPTDIINALTAAVSTGYALLLPTADVAVAIGVTIPAYDASLFVDNLTNPLDAIGLPIAADTGLLVMAGGVELLAITETVQEIMSDLSGLIPF